MLSLRERIDLLEADLVADPPRVTVHSDLPFAILRYEPQAEWDLRHELSLLATRLEQRGRRAHFVPLADLLWAAVDAGDGMDAVVKLERERGFIAAQEQVHTYLSHRLYSPLPEALAKRLNQLDPARDIAFLVRAGAMAPAIYQMSKLLEQMQGRTRVTTILCYPGTIEGRTDLRFMDLAESVTFGNYRVKIYGSE